MSALANRLDRLERILGAVAPEPTEADVAQYDWFADSCPCGLPSGECREHPRARPNQRPPQGDDWSTWLFLAGRGSGKTRAACEWLRRKIEAGECRRVALVGATAADVRDVLVEGPAGILAVSPPWSRPKYEPSKRRLTWPNGAVGTTFSADEPDRLRGPQHDGALADEVAAWPKPEALDMLLMGLRLGSNPQLMISTTPKPSRLIKGLIADPMTRVIRGTTYENRAHLAPKFFDQIIAKYQGTRLGQHELLAEILEVSEAAWFSRFDVARHVSLAAEYDPRLPVHVGVDAGTSMTTAAVFFQARQLGPYQWRVTVFGDYLKTGSFSAENASGIKAKAQELPCRGRADSMAIDPASTQRSGLGVTAYVEYERVFGRILSRAPGGLVVDGLDQIEVLLDQSNLVLHPRCEATKAAFQNYARAKRGGEYLNEPAQNQSPYEDPIDALRYGIRARFPEGRVEQPALRQVSVRKFL